MTRIIAVMALAFALGGCVAGYTLVKPEPVSVAAGSMKVKPAIAWNKVPRSGLDIPKEESWTQNGALLDSITFIGGLNDGEAITKQRPKDDRKVPVFRSDMTPQDLVSMIESLYRIRGQISVFETNGVKPTTFLGQQGIEFDFSFVGADDVKRRGRSVLTIVNGKFYVIALEGTALHYFEAALGEFHSLAASATVTS